MWCRRSALALNGKIGPLSIIEDWLSSQAYRTTANRATDAMPSHPAGFRAADDGLPAERLALGQRIEGEPRSGRPLGAQSMPGLGMPASPGIPGKQRRSPFHAHDPCLRHCRFRGVQQQPRHDILVTAARALPLPPAMPPDRPHMNSELAIVLTAPCKAAQSGHHYARRTPAKNSAERWRNVPA